MKADEELVEAAGKEKLSIKPKDKAKKKLNKKGEAKVNAEVTFALARGEPNTESYAV